MFTQHMAANTLAGFVRGHLKKMAIAGALMSGVALAPAASAGWYFGANAGQMLIDNSGVDDPTNAGVLVGREWGVVLGDVGVQAEFTTSIHDGSFVGNAVSVDSQALYGVFRTAGPVYLIAKAGVQHDKVDLGTNSSSDSGIAGGLGVGFSIGVARFELEYTRLQQDVSYFSLGLRM